MKLLFDIGNSRIKWAWLSEGTLQHAGHVGHRDRDPASVLAELPLAGPAPAAVLVASVATVELTEAVTAAVRRAWDLPVRMAAAEDAACGVRCGYTDPHQLGVDRWLAMLAAYQTHRGALCIADIGTALTIDAVMADGQHLGGLIVPGLAMMQSALRRNTGRIDHSARLAPGPLDIAASGWGRDTEACMRDGALLAITSLIRQAVRNASGNGGRATLVVTGGDAPVVIPGLVDSPVVHRPLLVLEGLALRHGRE